MTDWELMLFSTLRHVSNNFTNRCNISSRQKSVVAKLHFRWRRDIKKLKQNINKIADLFHNFSHKFYDPQR